MLRFLLFLCLRFVYAQECENGVWTHQTDDKLPHIDCSSAPVHVRWSALTPQRCHAWREDSDWPLADPYIARRASWHNARALIAAMKNKRVWIIGDSIANLWWSGIRCELYRQNVEFEITQNGPLAYLAENSDSLVDIPYEYWFFKHHNTTFVRKGWATVFREEWEFIIPNSDLIIVNYGHHYHNLSLYRDDMTWLFAKLESAERKTIFYETSAQHYRHGAFEPTPEHGSKQQCSNVGADELFSSENEIVVKNNLVDKLVDGMKHVKIYPFYNVTAPRWNLHEAGFCAAEQEIKGQKSDCLDCTHYTFTPTLWASIINDIVMMTRGLRPL